MPELRAETVRDVRQYAARAYEDCIRAGAQEIRPAGPPASAAAHMRDAEVVRLASAELFYVSEPMARLALSVAPSMPEFNLLPEDLPARTGFMFCETPIQIIDYMDQEPSYITAASWGYWNAPVQTKWNMGAVWVTFYADLAQNMQGAVDQGIVAGDIRDAALRQRGRLILDNEYQAPFSKDAIPVGRPDGTVLSWDEAWAEPDTGFFKAFAIVKTIWTLMSQTVSTVSQAHYDRASRRRLQRQDIEPVPVRVVTLRRASTARSSEGGDGQRDYRYQWLVRGHWRQQWYPSRGAHRPVWIDPHVKGPEGAPLLGGEKVYALRR